MGMETAAGTARAATIKPVPQAAIRAVADTLRDAGTDPGSLEATGGEVSFQRARMANEVLKAQTAKVPPCHQVGRNWPLFLRDNVSPLPGLRTIRS